MARTEGLYRARYPAPGEVLGEEAFELVARLPAGGGHSSRTLGLGPDGRLYVSLGIAGNCSDQYLDASYPFPDRRGGMTGNTAKR